MGWQFLSDAHLRHEAAAFGPLLQMGSEEPGRVLNYVRFAAKKQQYGPLAVLREKEKVEEAGEGCEAW